jgi:hypothetical protein
MHNGILIRVRGYPRCLGRVMSLRRRVINLKMEVRWAQDKDALERQW